MVGFADETSGFREIRIGGTELKISDSGKFFPMENIFLTISLMALEPVGALSEFEKAVIPDITLMHEV